MQNLVVGSHTVCAHVGGPKNFGSLGPRPLEIGAKLALTKLGSSPTCIIIVPNFVALGQIVWAQVECPKNLGDAGDPHPWMGRG